MSLVDLINSISSWAQNIIGTMGYPGLALVMFLENIFPPLPSEVILPMAGFMTTPQNTTTVNFTILGVTLVGCLGSLVGAWAFYGLAAWFGEQRIRVLIRKIGKYLLLKESDFDKALDFFNRYHSHVIFFGRFIPIIRSLISLPAGIARMNPLVFSIYTAAGTAIWSFILTFAGRILGENWPVISTFIKKYEKGVLIAGIALVAIFFVTRLYNLIRKNSAINPG